jgi:hypothetical protein
VREVAQNLLPVMKRKIPLWESAPPETQARWEEAKTAEKAWAEEEGGSRAACFARGTKAASYAIGEKQEQCLRENELIPPPQKCGVGEMEGGLFPSQKAEEIHARCRGGEGSNFRHFVHGSCDRNCSLDSSAVGLAAVHFHQCWTLHDDAQPLRWQQLEFVLVDTWLAVRDIGC